MLFPNNICHFVLLWGSLYQTSLAAQPRVSTRTCDFNVIQVQPNFDTSRFLGVWYEAMRTTFQWGSNTWNSQVWNIKQARNGTMFMSYTGVVNVSLPCTNQQTGKLSPQQTPGKFILSAENVYEASRSNRSLPFPTHVMRHLNALRTNESMVMLRIIKTTVVYTDYDHIALVYMCYEQDQKIGLCHINKVHVSFMTRTIPLSDELKNRLFAHIDNVCASANDIMEAKTGFCPIPQSEVIVGR